MLFSQSMNKISERNLYVTQNFLEIRCFTSLPKQMYHRIASKGYYYTQPNNFFRLCIEQIGLLTAQWEVHPNLSYILR